MQDNLALCGNAPLSPRAQPSRDRPRRRFHAHFGGTPRPSQFLNTRSTAGIAVDVPDSLRKHAEEHVEADAALYRLACAEFERRLRRVRHLPCYRQCLASAGAGSRP